MNIKPLKHGATPGPYIEKIFLDPNRIRDPKHFAFQLPALRGFQSLELHPNVTFFVGENGSGKSTLLESIAVANQINAEGGSRNVQFETRSSHSQPLADALKMRCYHALVPDAWFLRAESFFNVASEIERLDAEPARARKLIDSYGGVSLHEQSHGESFMALIENRFRQGLYLLDEPEAALSPQRQLEFLVLLDRLVTMESQLIIATHSPIIMSYPKAIIYHFSDQGLRPIQYKETEHYRVTKQFMESPERMLRHLFDGQDS